MSMRGGHLSMAAYQEMILTARMTVLTVMRRLCRRLLIDALLSYLSHITGVSYEQIREHRDSAGVDPEE